MAGEVAAAAVGLGFRVAYFEALARPAEGIDFVEAITENFLVPGSPARAHLEAARRHRPVVLHGVGLNLLSAAPLDAAYLDAVARLADALDAPWVSDHLCWTASPTHSSFDLLPAPRTALLVELAAERAAFVQRRLGRPFALENISTYVDFVDSSLGEGEFYASVLRAAGCPALLDVNNVFVSATNMGFDPRDFVDGLAGLPIVEVHLAGHTREAAGNLVDTHDGPVADEVAALYRHAWATLGPFPTLLEWDARLPPLSRAVDELDRIRTWQRSSSSRTASSPRLAAR